MTVRTAKGNGIVTTIVLESDVLDEIDWEWLGGVDGVVQSNFFSKGDTSSYGKLESELAVPSGDDKGTFHTYSLNWTPEKLEWSIDGTVLRTLPYAGNENTYPQTPMMVKFGTWCAGCSDAPGTVEWAGGAPDWSQAPFTAYYQDIKITDHSNGVANAETYQYTDQTGSMASIKINTGSGSTQNSGSGDGSNKSDAQSTATTLSTATGVGGSPAAATANGVQVGQVESAQVSSNSTGSNSTDATTTPTSTSTSTSSSGSSSTTVVTSGAQKGAVNVALAAAAMFAFFSL